MERNRMKCLRKVIMVGLFICVYFTEYSGFNAKKKNLYCREFLENIFGKRQKILELAHCLPSEWKNYKNFCLKDDENICALACKTVFIEVVDASIQMIIIHACLRRVPFITFALLS